jgi:hypothetical protein
MTNILNGFSSASSQVVLRQPNEGYKYLYHDFKRNSKLKCRKTKSYDSYSNKVTVWNRYGQTASTTY